MFRGDIKARLHCTSLTDLERQHQRFHHIWSIGVTTHFWSNSLDLLGNLGSLISDIANYITALSLTLSANGLLLLAWTYVPYKWNTGGNCVATNLRLLVMVECVLQNVSSTCHVRTAQTCLKKDNAKRVRLLKYSSLQCMGPFAVLAQIYINIASFQP